MRLLGIEAVVFDLDGTLVHSTIDYGKMGRDVLEVLRTHGVEVDPSQRRIWQIIQRSGELLEEMGYGPPEREEIMRDITGVLNSVEMENVDEVSPVEGAKETLERLKAIGLKIGIATRSCNAFAREALQRTGLEGLVDMLLARDETPHPKPDPRHLFQVIEGLQVPLEKVIYVGDTTTDLRTARGAGVTFIGFSTRAGGVERLRGAGCENVLESLKQLCSILGGSGG